MDKMLKPLLAIMLVAGSFSLTACNTMKGAGKDMEKAGETVQNCADRTDPSCKR